MYPKCCRKRHSCISRITISEECHGNHVARSSRPIIFEITTNQVGRKTVDVYVEKQKEQ